MPNMVEQLLGDKKNEFFKISKHNLLKTLPNGDYFLTFQKSQNYTNRFFRENTNIKCPKCGQIICICRNH